MAAAAHVHHGIDYIEFTVTDMAKAKAFYGAAFGWTFNEYGPSYAGIRRENGEAGGLRLDAKVATGGPLVILFSDDLEKSVRSVTEAGGTITKPPFSFPGGRRFQFKDPSGNELAVWSLK
ncbi:MAG: VOC family protein [Elusimicrobia bacterium]|nr:VOC family protein [Elusimicrobiota bacterium]